MASTRGQWRKKQTAYHKHYDVHTYTRKYTYCGNGNQSEIRFDDMGWAHLGHLSLRAHEEFPREQWEGSGWDLNKPSHETHTQCNHRRMKQKGGTSDGRPRWWCPSDEPCKSPAKSMNHQLHKNFCEDPKYGIHENWGNHLPTKGMNISQITCSKLKNNFQVSPVS